MFATCFAALVWCGLQAGELMALKKVDYHDTLKSLTSKAKAEGLHPEDTRLEDIVETGTLRIFDSLDQAF